ncbi:preprotein translocase subunit SecY [Pseudonocardia spinosispora]|uniref:preprotein translocase subunit SecY n=1 Tax=Pseudonocardia spinosispora TaxID=103441 RepID=UPI0003F700B4|nr:preprotein translocase subunit SecY [Pseudonocardia spinosispora]
MLGAFRSAFATPDLRRKILFTLAVVVAYRLGAAIPAPGVSFPNVQRCMAQTDTTGGPDVFALLNLFSGGALLQLSVFAVGIMPFITASIVVQLLTVVVPRFEQLKKEGSSGQATLTQYTRYLSIGIATLQAVGVVALAGSGQLFGGCQLPVFPDTSPLTMAITVLVMVAGSALLMWFGELITEKGLGNGMSILMFTSIAHRLPTEASAILTNAGPLVFAGLCLFGLAIIVSVVFVEQAQRRIPVQYAKRMVGRRMYGGTSTYLPIKVNQAGVVPVIFGSSLLFLPNMAAQVAGPDSGFGRFVQSHLADQSSWTHIALYATLIVFFTYFHVGITFNPKERSEEMKKFGGFIPGFRPGNPTTAHLRFVLNRITLPGSLYLATVAVLPDFFLGVTGGSQSQSFPFGGTSVLIMVGVGLDTVKRIEAQLMQRNYEGFLR